MELTRKSRPVLIEETLGNLELKQDLISNITKNTLFPKYIFAGEAGIGKTTIAMCISLALQCPNSQEGKPCLQCETCKEIMETLFMNGEDCCNIYMINMANKKSIDDARELIEMWNWAKSRKYPYTIFILEEPQNMSDQAQDVWNKPLEHLPPHVKIFFTTTKLSGLTDALKSRCLTSHLKPPSEEDTIEHLQSICYRNFAREVPKNILSLIVEYANGVPRDALNYLEQVINTGELSIERINQTLGHIDFGLYIEFFQIIKKDFFQVSQFIQEIRIRKASYVQFVENLHLFMTDVFKMKNNIQNNRYTSKQYTQCRKLFNEYSYKDFMKLQILSSSLALASTNTAYQNERYAESQLYSFALTVNQNFSVVDLMKKDNATVIDQKAVSKYRERQHEDMVEKQKTLGTSDVMEMLTKYHASHNSTDTSSKMQVNVVPVESTTKIERSEDTDVVYDL